MYDIEDLKQMFPSLTEEEIREVIGSEREDDIITHLSHLTEMKEKRTGIDPTLRNRFPRLTEDEIKNASLFATNRDELLKILKNIENDKSKTLLSDFDGDFTMSVIGGVLADRRGNIEETIQTLKALKIQSEDPDLKPIEDMEDDERLIYENLEIENRKNEVAQESVILKRDLFENNDLRIEERMEHENRIKMLEAEQEICTLTLKYKSNEYFINLCYRFNEDYPLNGYEWIGLYKEDSGVDNYVSYVNVKSILNKNSCQLKLPKINGYYVVRLVDGKSKQVLLESNAIHVGPQVNFIAILNEESKKILLHFDIEEGELCDKDWVSFTRKDKKNKAYISAHYLIKYLVDAKSGVIEVPMPRRPLQYEFRYFPAASGYNPLKISNTIKVPKHDKLEIEVLESKIKVTWDIHAVDVSSWDYIALYKEEETVYVKSQYVDVKKNYLLFDLPRAPGSYVLKYWACRIGSAPLDISAPIFVENKDKLVARFSNNVVEVEWDIHSVDVTSKDWIALFKYGDPNNKAFESYEYVRTCANNQVLEKMPKEKGEYEVRYFSSSKSKYDHLVASNRINIE